jgi:AAA domain (dynein-related subfamily)
MASEIPGVSLADVRSRLEERKADTKVLDAASTMLDILAWLGALALGPDAATKLFGILEAKNALAEVGRRVIEKFAKPPKDYREQARRLEEANCLLTYVAYFEALGERLPSLMKQFTLSAEERVRVAAASADDADLNARLRELFGTEGSYEVADLLITVPFPADLDSWSKARVRLYGVLGLQVLRALMTNDNLWAALGADEQAYARIVLTEDVPGAANRIYRAYQVGLTIDYPGFLAWLTLADQEMGQALLDRVAALLTGMSEDDKARYTEITASFARLDQVLGSQMDELTRQAEELKAVFGTRAVPREAGPIADDVLEVATILHQHYEKNIQKPVIDDKSESSDDVHVSYPLIKDAYVPHAFRWMRYSGSTTGLEREEAWKDLPRGQDLRGFLVTQLKSIGSERNPLLILGHPGSGKSMLTQILAAELPYPTVRVKLRDVSPGREIWQQIEEQIRLETRGEKVGWSKYARSLPTPPVVILDGYDEMLQATGTTHANYLDQVRRFQEDEADDGRPLRVIVTSRITLVDDVVTIPDGTTIIRLEEFDEMRRQQWIGIWNDRNRGYFQHARPRVQEFRLPNNRKIVELASQPLLLLLLAVYDADGNPLGKASPDIDQTQLYYRLIIKFIQRELKKDESGYGNLSGQAKQQREAQELKRLGVAAVGMFNRQAVALSGDDLNNDLAFFTAAGDRPAAGGNSLSPAELLVGSFLFIQESSSGAKTAYEFLHKTFGEFLTAEFLLAQVLEEASTVAAYLSVPALEKKLPGELEQLNPEWFACLVHTPLHTQPNVLAMLRTWAPRRPMDDGMPGWPVLLDAIDRILVAQLRGLLTATMLPKLVPVDGTPYGAPPVLGCVAIYTLNLVMLRTYLSDDGCVLDEAALGGQPGEARPWDRLTALWRGWFAPESVAALASCLTATRTGATLTIVAAESPLATRETTALGKAYNASLALADDLTTASLGLHLTSLTPVRDTFLDDLRARVRSEAPDLVPVIDLTAARLVPHHLQQARAADRNISLAASPGYLPAGMAVTRAELADHLYRSPLSRADLRGGFSDPLDFMTLSRYAAEVATRLYTEIQPTWLSNFLFDLTADELRELLSGPAAAPPLRAARRGLGDAGLAKVASAIGSKADIERDDSLFDADTAVGVAVLAWRAQDTALCHRVLDHIIAKVKDEKWRLDDVPAEAWSDLTDILVSPMAEPEARRQRFAALLLKVAGGTDHYDYSYQSFQFYAATLAIQADDAIDAKDVMIYLAVQVTSHTQFGSEQARRSFLLLIRSIRQRAAPGILARLFRLSRDRPGSTWRHGLGAPPDQTPGTFDVEAACESLTYREADDLRWAFRELRKRKRD